jgi:hypothetical protein
MDRLPADAPLRAKDVPTLLLPDTLVVGALSPSLAHPGRVAVKITVDAVWVSSVRGRTVLTYGTLWDVYGASNGGARVVPVEKVARLYSTRRFDESYDRAVSFDGTTWRTFAVLSPAQRTRLGHLLRALHAELDGALGTVHDVPAGTVGWYGAAVPSA